jgi:formylmethanofuran dehydrogenase subunit E
MANKGQFSGKKHPMFGKKHSLISLKKMSSSQKKRFARDGGYWLGRKRSEETKRKVSQSQLGRIISLETIEKRRAKMIGHKTSPETRRKISEAQKGKSRPQTSGNKNGKTLCEKCHEAFHKINWKNQHGK